MTFSGPSVESFLPDVTPTGATSLAWSLVFDEPVTGLAPADITPGGTSTGWSVTNVAGSGTDWTITTQALNPGPGPLILTLAADAVGNDGGRSGPNDPYASEPAIILPFSDITGSTFRDDIVWLYESGITTGCGVRLYCPVAPVTRAQMASFLARALDLPATTTDFFDDDDGSTHEVNINRLAAAGITLGCGPSLYCPNANVTRAQMASFLVRALGLTAGRRHRRLHRRRGLDARGRHQPVEVRRADHWLHGDDVLPCGERHPRPDGGVPPPGIGRPGRVSAAAFSEGAPSLPFGDESHRA